jgi:hypothetical protein
MWVCRVVDDEKQWCREITQDEFLPEVTSSKKVICHFYHNDFQRCKIMDKVRTPSAAHTPGPSHLVLFF